MRELTSAWSPSSKAFFIKPGRASSLRLALEPSAFLCSLVGGGFTLGLKTRIPTGNPVAIALLLLYLARLLRLMALHN